MGMKTIISAVSLFCLLVLSGCGGKMAMINDQGEDLVGADGVVTLVNLHPDMNKGPRLTAINWQMPALIPMCTEVAILEASSKQAVILDRSTDIQYTYYYHKAAAEPFDVHLKRFFGKSCDKNKVAKMSKIDRDGIKAGKIKKGMTKQGVLYAAGYPPKHKTPSLDLDTWRYWKNRWNTMVVTFENDKVVNIID